MSKAKKELVEALGTIIIILNGGRAKPHYLSCWYESTVGRCCLMYKVIAA